MPMAAGSNLKAIRQSITLRVRYCALAAQLPRTSAALGEEHAHSAEVASTYSAKSDVGIEVIVPTQDTESIRDRSSHGLIISIVFIEKVEFIMLHIKLGITVTNMNRLLWGNKPPCLEEPARVAPPE